MRFYWNILEGALCSSLLLGQLAPAYAGIGETPLPVFSDGKQSVQIVAVTGVVKRFRLETQFVCTSLAGEPVDVGVQVFDSLGTLLSDVSADIGVVLGLVPGQTVTISTSATAAFLETETIPLPEIEQGSARIVASSRLVQCRVWILDQALTPPLSMGELPEGVRPAVGGVPGLALPRLPNGVRATHSLVVPGVVKRSRVETNFFCTSTASVPIHLGVEVFGPDGERRNDLASGNGAVVDVAPGATVTIGTTGTTAFLEDTVIVLEGVAQGFARIVATSGDVICMAALTESDIDPPVGLASLRPHRLGRAAPTSTPTQTSPPTATFTARPTATPQPTPTTIVGCTGDCDDDGAIRVSELITGVRISLGLAELSTCSSFDVDGNGALAVNELIRAVNAALRGCVPL